MAHLAKRDARVRYKYGMTLGDYDYMLRLQGGGCAICGHIPERDEILHIDHDHACCHTRKKLCGNCNRGLLCGPCNKGLGFFRDNINSMKSAIKYLEVWNGA